MLYEVITVLVDLFRPMGILEKSTSTSRKTEGLEEVRQVLYGEVPDEVVIVITSYSIHYTKLYEKPTGCRTTLPAALSSAPCWKRTRPCG